jgi:solute carrier family 9 (sodium/hydrogen exchanger), member 8
MGSNKTTPSSQEHPVSSSSEAPAPSNTTTTPSPDPVLPDKGSAEAEKNSSMAIFFVLCVLALCILFIHFMLLINFQYLPESVVIVFLGALIGLVINLMSNQNIANWKKEEAFSPTAFFLVLLPPIIFESGYNLHKGNFFQNIGSILVFAIFGTLISALVIGGGVYMLGIAQVAYQLSFVESLAFGSLISAVDPVATVAIFHALDIDPVLNMLVFGESILNDAVAIVLTNTVLQSASADVHMSPGEALVNGIGRYESNLIPGFCQTYHEFFVQVLYDVLCICRNRSPLCFGQCSPAETRRSPQKSLARIRNDVGFYLRSICISRRTSPIR